MDKLVDTVLSSVGLDGDVGAASRILAQHPEIGTHDFYTAVATGNLAEVQRRLATDTSAASREGGPLACEPLLYLAYTRLPGAETDALAIARTLLDHGANANARFVDDWDNPFTALTGVIGEGEGNRPPHPRAEALAELLIERGANPFDTQALYNTSITRDDIRWLEFLWTHSERRGLAGHWTEKPSKVTIGGKVPLSVLDYLLGNAVVRNHINRVDWLLKHGAHANSVHAYSLRPLREEALLHGRVAIADLLASQGAATAPLQGYAAFQAACARLDREAARALATQHPEYLRNATPMLIAADSGRADIVAFLLELGMDVDVADATQQRGLHNATAAGNIEIMKLLIAHGADIDRPTTQFGGPLGFAAHFQQREAAALLAPLSKDVLHLAYLGLTERLQELFETDPALANTQDPRSGLTPLFALPDNEAEALAVAALLLQYGADPNFKKQDGITAEQDARNRGLTRAADAMRAHRH